MRGRSGVEVITRSEVTAALSVERKRAMLGCAIETCMAELEGALGAPSRPLVTGDPERPD